MRIVADDSGVNSDAGLDDSLLLLVAITMGLTLAHAREIMQVSLEQPALDTFEFLLGCADCDEIQREML
jgi:hypothetical protein